MGESESNENKGNLFQDRDTSDSSLNSISKILSKRKLVVKISDKYSWRGLYRPKNTFKKGLKSPRKNSYNGPKPKVVYLIKTQILSEEKQAELDTKLENGEIHIKYL